MRLLLYLAAAGSVFLFNGVLAAENEDPLIALRTAAVSGEPQALTELALKYENAEGLPKDQRTANSLYCRAARLGYAQAQFRLGWAYANGRGAARDDAAAAALFAMAAEQGHEYAARLLAYLPESAGARLPDCMEPERPVAVPVDGTERVAAGGAVRPGMTVDARIPNAIRQIVYRLAPKYAVDTDLALAVIAVESDFDAAAVSPRNAQGLMQLMPETAARFGVQKPFNPVENIKGGLAYLRWLLAFFEGDVRLVLAAYNAGERAVERYRGIPPYRETRDYVEKIAALYPEITHPYEPAVVRPSVITSHRRAAR